MRIGYVFGTTAQNQSHSTGTIFKWGKTVQLNMSSVN
jgi:hypothetical protein